MRIRSDGRTRIDGTVSNYREQNCRVFADRTIFNQAPRTNATAHSDRGDASKMRLRFDDRIRGDRYSVIDRHTNRIHNCHAFQKPFRFDPVLQHCVGIG